MDLSQVEVVLVRPSRAANVAASCRAMKNMGLRALRLVEAGRPPVVDEAARSLAYGAWDVLDGAQPADSLVEAVAECTFVVATTGRAVPGAWDPRRLAAEVEMRSRGGRTALVFGPESSGLRRDEMDLCHALVHVPTDPGQPSLNLAQAVLLLAYELRLAAAHTSGAVGGRAAVPAGEIEQAVQQWRLALLEIGFLDEANPDRILTELRRLLARAGPTSREILLLRGLARQVAWAGRVARGRPGNG